MRHPITLNRRKAETSGGEAFSATWQYQLLDPPAQPRARELWLLHGAGFILVEEVRRYAMEQFDPELDDKARAAVQSGIDNALYRLMQATDGVTGSLSNEDHAFSIGFVIRLRAQHDSHDPPVVFELDPQDGDGMCLGCHGWLEGDYEPYPIAFLKASGES